MSTINLLDPIYIEKSKGNDPVSKTYLGPNGRYYRGIKTEARDWLALLREKKIIEALQERGLIPAQKFAPSATDDYAEVMISDGVPFPVHVSQYPLLAIKHAALMWIEINEFLDTFQPEMGLIDGHYGNVALFPGGVPKWVDIGSIGQLKSHQQGIQEFIRYFINPLIIFEAKPEQGEALRQRIRRPKGGLKKEEVAAYGVKPFSLDKKLSRADALSILKSRIADMQFSENRDFWADYRKPEVLSRVEDGRFLSSVKDPRFETIMSIVQGLEPDTVIDVGANDGLFSCLVSGGRIPTLAIDTDDFSLNKLFQFLREGGRVSRQIIAAKAGFADVKQQADVVMALALTHHLVLKQNMTFDEVAGKLAGMAKRAVVTEFMPDGRGGTRTHPAVSPNPLPEWYSLETFLTALKRRFAEVEVVDYGRVVEFSRRILIVCKYPL